MSDTPELIANSEDSDAATDADRALLQLHHLQGWAELCLQVAVHSFTATTGAAGLDKHSDAWLNRATNSDIS
jgi:hypothetical protein